MKLPKKFIENNFKLFTRFCKDNDMYQDLVFQNQSLSLVIEREKQFFERFNREHKVDMIPNIIVPIEPNFSDNECFYFSLVRLLNLEFVGSLDQDSNEFQNIHKKLFDFCCFIKPNLKKYKQ